MSKEKLPTIDEPKKGEDTGEIVEPEDDDVQTEEGEDK